MARQLELKPLAASDLYNRRLAQSEFAEFNGNKHQNGTHLEAAKCARCHDGFRPGEPIVNTTTSVYHKNCFVCAQCFRPFPDGVYFDVDDRKYCEHDFQVLFAPSCAKCQKFIIGRVIKALNANWHPNCFRCELCDGVLADEGFLRNNGRALCRSCNTKEKAAGHGKHVCYKCRGIIDDGPLKYKMEFYHPYHFSCKQCGEELNSDARELKSELYCLKCHDRLCMTCAACRRPIEDARTVHALGKQWHHEHFVCASCEKPFLGTRFYEKKGKAYCEKDFHQLFGNCCFKCSATITGDCLEVFQKCWCRGCFSCTLCDKAMDQTSKFYEMDTKPVCKKCYDRFPKELQRRLVTLSKNKSPLPQETKKAAKAAKKQEK